MVYKLYSLNYDECKIIAPATEMLISREAYETRNIEQLAALPL